MNYVSSSSTDEFTQFFHGPKKTQKINEGNNLTIFLNIFHKIIQFIVYMTNIYWNQPYFTKPRLYYFLKFILLFNLNTNPSQIHKKDYLLANRSIYKHTLRYYTNQCDSLLIICSFNKQYSLINSVVFLFPFDKQYRSRINVVFSSSH